MTNNVVKISSGSVGGIVAGGYTIGKGAEGNTVELSGTADVSGNIYGGYALHQMDNPLTGEAAAGDASQNTVKFQMSLSRAKSMAVIRLREPQAMMPQATPSLSKAAL